MPTWIRKSLVVMFTILTFGLVTPPQLIIADAKSPGSQKADIQGDAINHDSQSHELTATFIHKDSEKNHFLELAITEAEQQSIKKFGTTIEKRIGDEFRVIILPKMEEVIMSLSDELSEEQLANLVITKQPTGGTSEKIFHIIDGQTGKDLIRFHVRRDHPPLDGYYFNFHYHTSKDQFQAHHILGEIYWDKNTPPNWNIQ
ncbi:YpjP family protein [Bacillus salitolerans]|uniref:YpjP family protein n=1 Tax=Bacillus salitolerans TaxID=1437434 RepID=A0ABW4LTG5_9BACI